MSKTKVTKPLIWSVYKHIWLFLAKVDLWHINLFLCVGKQASLTQLKTSGKQ